LSWSPEQRRFVNVARTEFVNVRCISTFVVEMQPK